MNIVVVFLGIIIIILIYVLYTYITQKPIDINNLVYLKTETKTINSDLIKSPTSASHAYATWIYVNSWESTKTKTLIKKGVDEFKLYLDTASPILKVDIKNNSSTDIITLTTNFPIQKWVYVIVSIDGQIMDFYLDGKLVMSKQLAGLPVTNSNTSIVIGDTTNLPDIYLARISRWPNAVDPQTAWDTYMQGNGQSNALNNQYNVKLAVLKNNIETKNFSLF